MLRSFINGFKLLSKIPLWTPKANYNTQLGRWNYNYDETSLERKVRLANEDHCGVCDITNLSNDNHNENDIFCYIADCCGNGCPGCDIYKKLTIEKSI